MKTTKKIITAIFIIFCYTFSNAQNNQNTTSQPMHIIEQQKHYLTLFNYIFEGKVIQQSINGGWMCSVLQITKIFKGSPQIKLGTIKVVSDIGSSDIPPIIRKGSTYIIFGKPANPSFDTIQIADNLLTLQCIDHIDFHGVGASWGWRQITQYKTVDSVYSFFKQNGLEVQEEVGQTGGVK